MRLLPDPADLERLQGEAAPWLPAMRVVRERHGGGDIAPTGLGSNVLLALGDDHLVKLFPPAGAPEHTAERAALEAVHGRLGVATPEVLAHGEVEGWPYLVIPRLPAIYIG